MSTLKSVTDAYFDAINRMDREALEACLAPDAKAYSPHGPHSPNRKAICDFLMHLQEYTDAVWSIDQQLEQDDRTVIEWSCVLRMPYSGRMHVLRGVDWISFGNGVITEIRKWTGPDLTPESVPRYQLQDYPYTERGYPDLP